MLTSSFRTLSSWQGLESFNLVFSPTDGTKVAIQAPNRYFLQTTPGGKLVANVKSSKINGEPSTKWGASAFTITNVSGVGGVDVDVSWGKGVGLGCGVLGFFFVSWSLFLEAWKSFELLDVCLPFVFFTLGERVMFERGIRN